MAARDPGPPFSSYRSDVVPIKYGNLAARTVMAGILRAMVRPWPAGLGAATAISKVATFPQTPYQIVGVARRLVREWPRESQKSPERTYVRRGTD